MRLSIVEARDLDEAFFLCCKEVLEKGRDYLITRGSEEGTFRRELDFITLRVLYPWTRPLSPTTPEGVPTPTSDSFIDSYMSYLMTSLVQENEEYTYGYYLESQIEEVIKKFHAGGEGNNQLCMTIGDKDSIYMKDPPCLRLIDCKIRDGILNFVVSLRSWDLWGGFPANLGGLELLKQYMASMMGVGNGELIATSKGLHLYQRTWDLARQVIGQRV